MLLSFLNSSRSMPKPRYITRNGQVIPMTGVPGGRQRFRNPVQAQRAQQAQPDQQQQGQPQKPSPTNKMRAIIDATGQAMQDGDKGVARAFDEADSDSKRVWGAKPAWAS